MGVANTTLTVNAASPMDSKWPVINGNTVQGREGGGQGWNKVRAEWNGVAGQWDRVEGRVAPGNRQILQQQGLLNPKPLSRPNIADPVRADP